MLLGFGVAGRMTCLAADDPAEPHPHPPARVLGVLPNYRTTDASLPYKPLTAREKFYIGYKDSTDYPIFFVTGFFAGVSQLSGSNASFGGGMLGFGRRFGSAYADQAMGTMFTESVFPTVLKQDPRYFRLGTGTIRSRAIYAATRVFVTKTDSGARAFNYTEWFGNSAMTAASCLYSPATRSASGAAQKLAVNVGTDALGAVLKEFWPDVKRRLFNHHASPAP